MWQGFNDEDDDDEASFFSELRGGKYQKEMK